MTEYDAFISYSHSADNDLAPKLQSALHRFAKPWWKLRAVRVFRDTTNLAVSPALWPSIVKSLERSNYFLLMASPGAAKSQWVGREVEHWLSEKAHNKLVIVLTEGEMLWSEQTGGFDWSVTTALPRVMEGSFRHEPLYVDMRWARTDSDHTLQNPRFAASIAQIAATLHGRDLDEMIGEDVAQHRRTRWIMRAAVATLAGLTVVSAGAAYVALQQKNLADERLVISEEARRDAEIARNDAEEQRAVAVEARDNEAAARRAAEAAEEQERQARVTAEARLLAAEATQALYEEDGLITRAALLSVASLRAAPNDRAAEVARIVLARLGEPIGITGDVPDDHRLAGLRDQVEANMKTAERSPAFSVDFETWTASLKIFGQDAGEISSQQFWEPISCQEAPSWMKVTTSASNTALRVTDTRSGRFRVVVHDGWIVACKVLNRGELLVTASGEVARELPPVPLPGDGTLVVWDLRKSLFSYGASFSGTESVVATDFSADGRFATLSELRGDEVPIFDLKTGKRIVGLVPSHPGSVTGLAFSPDGTHLAVAPIYEEEYDLFSGEAFSERKVLAGQHGEGNVHFSPDGTYLVTDYGGLSGGGADLWRTDDVSSAVQSFTGNSNVDLLFLSDGTGFVELGYDGAVLWRIGDQEPALQFGGPGSDTGLISTDNSVVALSDQGGSISLWPLSAKQASRRIGEGDWVRPHAFSPDGSLLVLSEDSRLVVRAVSDGKVMYSRDYGESIGAATFSQSGRFLAVSTYGYGGQEITGLNASTVLDIFETETWTRVARLNPRGLVRELEFSADETWLRSATYLSEESGAAPAFIWLWQREALIERMCARLPRDFSADEWAEYFPNRPYEPVCAG